MMHIETKVKNSLLNSLAFSSLILLASYCSGLATAEESVKIVASSTTGALTLDEAMRLASSHSYIRLSVEQDKLSSEARQTAIKGGTGPKLSVEAARGWIDTSVNKMAGKTLPTGQRYPDEINSVAAVVQQPITQIFAARSRLEAERNVLKATNSQLIVEGNDAKLKGAEAYIQALKAVRFLAINRESQELIGKQMRDAGALRESGKLSELDYSRFELAASEANTLVIEAEARLRVAADVLRETLGLEGNQDLKLAELNDLSEVTAEKHSQSERSELTGASQRIEALESQVKAQRVDYWPQVNAYARYSRDLAAKDVNLNSSGIAINIPKEDFRDQLSYGFTFQWDVWDWGTRSGRHAEVGVQLVKARITRDSLASRLRVESAQANAEWDRAVQTLKNAKVADKLSAQILKSFDLRFRNGLATTTDLLSIQRDRARAQSNLANATYDLQGAQLRRLRAAGASL